MQVRLRTNVYMQKKKSAMGNPQITQSISYIEGAQWYHLTFQFNTHPISFGSFSGVMYGKWVSPTPLWYFDQVNRLN